MPQPGVADRAAEQVERAGAYLRDNDADTLLGDVERVGREQPWAVAAAAFALGLVAARALKASSAKRYSRIPGGVGRTPTRGRPGPACWTRHDRPAWGPLVMRTVHPGWDAADPRQLSMRELFKRLGRRRATSCVWRSSWARPSWPRRARSPASARGCSGAPASRHSARWAR